MSFVNNYTKEINCKIVFYGPALGGKTTCIKYIYNQTSGDTKNNLVSLDTDQERTLFFDFLPLHLGQIRGFKTRFHLYTVPGQSFYESSRKLILRGVDGIIFVADSQIDKMEDNLESLRDLESNLEEEGYELSKMPMVFMWNKRDLPNIVSTIDLNSKLNKYDRPSVETTAVNGQGVFNGLKLISKHVLLNVRGNFK